MMIVKVDRDVRQNRRRWLFGDMLCVLTISVCCLTSTSGQNFDAGGDGLTWEDANNWDGDVLPTGNTGIANNHVVTLNSSPTIGELDIGGNTLPDAGTLNHSSGALTGSGWLKIGGDGTSGSYNLSGTASASGFGNAFVGFGGGSGTLSVTDAAAFSSGELVITGTGTGTINTTGNVDVTNQLRTEESAALHVDGGNLAITDFDIQSSSSFNLNGGTVGTNTLSVRDVATVNHSAGTVSANLWVSIGSNEFAFDSNYNISGGSLESNADWLTIGESGAGDLHVSGDASVDSNGNGIIVGRFGSAIGLLEITGSSATVEGNDLRVGIDENGTDGGLGTLSWIADGDGLSSIVSLDNTELSPIGNANLLVDLTADANFDMIGTGTSPLEYVLIDNVSASTGNFAGLTEGAAVDIGGGKTGTISYAGGADGVDVVLTVLVAETTTVDGDFNGDMVWNCADLDALVAAIASGSTDLSFDMNGDNVIDANDVFDATSGWLAVGGANNSAATGGNPFLAGDATLDGNVDGQDFIEWNSNKFTSVAAWCSGDFNLDGVVDGQDFIVWNNNKFSSSDRVVPVPEASGHWLWLLVIMACRGPVRRACM